MYSECPDYLPKGEKLAWQIIRVKETLDGLSGAMKVTPFFVASSQIQLMDHLGIFAQDIENGASALKRLTRQEDGIAFDAEASGRDIIADMFLAQPCEKRIMHAFDRVRGVVWEALDEMKAVARRDAVILPEGGQKAMMAVNALYNVVRGTQDFYSRVPANATEGFIFR